ncbi:MAG: hypothetical protein RL186_1556 [Pseudomonadota bacterium]|jgi:hypothetical protein
MNAISRQAPPVISTHTIGEITFSPYEKNLVAQFAQRRHSVAESAMRRLAGLRAEANRLDHDLAHEALELARAQKRMVDKDQRAFISDKSTKFYWIGVALLLVGEIAVIKLALDFMRGGDIESWLLAIALSAASFMAAKFLARVIRQKSWVSRDWGACVLAGISGLVGVMLSFSLGSLRGIMVAHNIAAQAKMDGLPMPSAAEIDAASNPFTFASIQLFCFLAALLWTYFHTDPDSDREQINGLISRLEDRKSNLFVARVRIANSHNKIVLATSLRLNNLVHDCQECVAQVRDANMFWRRSEPPSYMRQNVPASTFEPISFGQPMDHHPAEIGTIIGAPQTAKEDA